ncbi:MAG: CooT family nickel-binding protein [Deltaproteobacteria bacterium]|nr:CooT family nickel-binding protein [Deltaproteobacteria bacterium]
MCEANAFLLDQGKEELIMESVDLLEPEEDGQYRLVNIFGEQKMIKARLKVMNLVDHRIIFEA